jgi:hypothetical protein
MQTTQGTSIHEPPVDIFLLLTWASILTTLSPIPHSGMFVPVPRALSHPLSIGPLWRTHPPSSPVISVTHCQLLSTLDRFGVPGDILTFRLLGPNDISPIWTFGL